MSGPGGTMASTDAVTKYLLKRIERLEQYVTELAARIPDDAPAPRPDPKRFKLTAYDIAGQSYGAYEIVSVDDQRMRWVGNYGLFDVRVQCDRRGPYRGLLKLWVPQVVDTTHLVCLVDGVQKTLRSAEEEGGWLLKEFSVPPRHHSEHLEIGLLLENPPKYSDIYPEAIGYDRPVIGIFDYYEFTPVSDPAVIP